MKIQGYTFFGIILICASASQAFAQTAIINPVVPTIGTVVATSTATPSSSPSSTMQVACIDDSGNATVPSTCNAILPKCSDLKTTYEGQVKNFLSWKIWGYYQGKNIDLNSSTLSATSPTYVGPALAYPICSLVGHKMQYLGTPPLKSGYNACDKPRTNITNAYQGVGIEYATQTIGSKTACGSRPNALTGDMSLTIKFVSGAGNLWDSWLIGAYPWLIRRYANDVLTAILPDLSNVGSVLTDASAISDWAAMNGKMSAYYSAMANDAKTVCISADPSANIVGKCSNGTLSLSDPANRLCTLVKAQTTLNTGALPNMLVKEIMARVQTNYDLLFDNLMTFQSGSAEALWSKCKKTGGLFSRGAMKKAMSASCLFDGADFYAYSANGTPAVENDCTGSGSHHASNPYVFRVADGAVSSVGNPQTLGSDKTLLLGFGSLVEYIIRHNICLQNTYSDVSVCDTINIPDKPAGVQ
jgi:hypothetical protein